MLWAIVITACSVLPNDELECATMVSDPMPTRGECLRESKKVNDALDGNTVLVYVSVKCEEGLFG